MYKELYLSLCENGKPNKERYGKHSGFHKHHIIPTHSGGTEDETNFTYVTPRIHAALHFLLWKIHRNPNDLRSMNMLGVELTSQQRKIVGEFCRDNKIGFHSNQFRNSDSDLERIKNSTATRQRLKVGIFDPTKKSEWAAFSGSIGGKVQKERKLGIFDPKWESVCRAGASQGGIALRGFIVMNNGEKTTRVAPQNVEKYRENGWNPGWFMVEKKITVNDGSSEFRIPKSQFEDFASRGFSKGGMKRSLPHRVFMTDGSENRKIPSEEVERHLDNGWRLGMTRHGRSKRTPLPESQLH